MIRTICVAATLALTALPAKADWVGKGELGGVLARGNTEAETLNAKVEATRETAQWTHLVGLSILRNTTDDETSANRWELRGESQYKLTPRSYLFGALRYEDDAFTDFAYQATASVGYGYKLVDTERTTLDAKLGAGVRRSELRATGETEGDAIVRGAVVFSHRLTDTTRIVDRFLVETGPSNTFVQNLLGLEVKMTDSLALGLSYELRHNTEVQPGTSRTDQVLSANLVFGF